MSEKKETIINITESDLKRLLEAGFVDNGDDPFFPYRFDLLSEDVISELEDANEPVPCLLCGHSGMNGGFCIFTGSHFVFINCQTAKDAVDFAKKIAAFESVH